MWRQEVTEVSDTEAEAEVTKVTEADVAKVTKDTEAKVTEVTKVTEDTKDTKVTRTCGSKSSAEVAEVTKDTEVTRTCGSKSSAEVTEATEVIEVSSAVAVVTEVKAAGSAGVDPSVEPWLHFPRMYRIWQQCVGEYRIKWNLADLEECNEIWHGCGFIRYLLWGGNRHCHFKIGITHTPYKRWSHPGYGYKAMGFHRMTFLYVSENSDDTAAMETALIEIYRYRDRQGNVVGNPGNPRCLNRAPGGESAHHGFSPFFVYVATKYQ